MTIGNPLEWLSGIFNRKEQLPSLKFEQSWLTYLETEFPLYHKLPSPLKTKLQDRIVSFISKVNFAGCNGFQLTDEVIVLISAQACFITLNLEEPCYPKLQSILVYPSTFSSIQAHQNSDGVITEEIISRLGESWDNGTVILAWDSVFHGARNIQDGHNVSIHEFAHQLDQEDGSTDGAPVMKLSRNELKIWCSVMQESYDKFLKIADKKGKTVIDHYGASHPSEFFSVVTETFFEKPKQLHKKWPELYKLMKNFYRLDPLSWYL